MWDTMIFDLEDVPNDDFQSTIQNYVDEFDIGMILEIFHDVHPYDDYIRSSILNQLQVFAQCVYELYMEDLSLRRHTMFEQDA